MWCCGDILQAFEIKVNKYVVFWRYPQITWNKVKHICGIVEIFSDYLEKR